MNSRCRTDERLAILVINRSYAIRSLVGTGEVVLRGHSTIEA
jgi:hypothetical protein